MLPPTAGACLSRGGGWQHGEWSTETTALRASGYLVANVLAGIDAPATVADPAFPEAFGQLLVERFLVMTRAPWLQQLLRDAERDVTAAASPKARYLGCASLLSRLRDALPRVASPAARLRLVDLSLAVETVAFRAATELRDAAFGMTRAERLALLAAASDPAHGTGHLNGRLRGEQRRIFATLAGPEARLGDYLLALGP